MTPTTGAGRSPMHSVGVEVACTADSPGIREKRFDHTILFGNFRGKYIAMRRGKLLPLTAMRRGKLLALTAHSPPSYRTVESLPSE